MANNTEKPRILVVDDRPENLLAMEHVLSSLDIEFVGANSGNDALTKMIHDDFALVLLDVQMPDMDGIEVASLMRDRDATRHTPIIFVTAIDSGAHHKFRGYESGAVDFLHKPVDADVLRCKAKVFLHLYRQRRELEGEIAEREIVEDQLMQYSAALENANRSLEDLRQDAESANDAKSEFLANMSHEIRTPMTAILGFADVLLGNVEESDITAAAITIKRNGQYLLELINDILDLSKIEAGKFQVERITCSPSKVVSEVASLMNVRAEAKGLPLEVELDGAIPATITCDPTRLRQILINLVGNAVKFTETGSVRMVVRLLQDDDSPSHLQFDIVDTGIGMTQQQATKLFQPFTQADTSTAHKFGGTGLGLTISKRLAEMLGGDITISSVAGRGSTFSLVVETGDLENVDYIDDIDSRTAEVVVAETAAPHTSLDCRILLAEDGPDNQRLISFVLRKAGADVTIAENGKIAHDQALSAQEAGTPFDVILMDMQMPVMDGYEATGKLRKAGYHGPIIALTANAMAGDAEKCLQAGCDDYNPKPIDRERLIAAISHQIQNNKQTTPVTRGKDSTDVDEAKLK